MDRRATCSRDGCLSTDYEERIAELEATLESFAAVDRARQAENAGIGDLYLEIDRLQAKVERLKEALLAVATVGTSKARQIARAALEDEL